MRIKWTDFQSHHNLTSQRSSREEKMGEKEEMALIEILDVEDDRVCFTPISRCGSNKMNPISVEQYAEDRDRRAITASLRQSPTFFIDLSQSQHLDDDDDEDPDDDVQVIGIKPAVQTPFSLRGPFVTETAQSSNSKSDTPSPPFMCEICAEPKPMEESFNINGCTHFYCTECMIKYVASKLQENITCIRCPVSNCHGLLEPEYCRAILPLEVFERWGSALCESVILGSEKFYCPFKDCSALLINDGGEVITQSECPNCWRMFCAQCKASWHSGIDCAEFQRLNKDEREREDIMMMQLAKNKSWKRCPKCRFYVEKSQGCMYMKCRCGFAFCYNCGAPSTTNSHLCSKCVIGTGLSITLTAPWAQHEQQHLTGWELLRISTGLRKEREMRCVLAEGIKGFVLCIQNFELCPLTSSAHPLIIK